MFHFKLPNKQTHTERRCGTTTKFSLQWCNTNTTAVYAALSHLHSTKPPKCLWQLHEKGVLLIGCCAFSWQTCDQAYLCVCLCVHLCRCVCVFIGLSGEPGQSVRCSNGGFKDKRCGEFPGCLLTNPPTLPPLPLPSSTIPTAGTQRDRKGHK